MSAAATPSRLSKLLELDLLDNRFPALHGLRVLAILSVLQFHVTWIFAGENGIWLNPAFRDASLTIFFGMDLFFILSGFLIGTLILHAQESYGRQKVGRFYLRRIFRTFPPYYIVLTALALYTPLTSNQQAHLAHEYAYLTNWVSLHRPDVIMFWGWSLSLEEQFYLAAPLMFWALFKLRSNRARLWVLGGLWLMALVVRLFIYLKYRPWADLMLYSALYFRTPTRFDTLICGIMLALVERSYGERIGEWLKAPLHRAMLALPAAACLWLLLQPAMFGLEHVQLVHVFAWGTVTSLMWTPFLLLLLHGDGPMHRALSLPIFRAVATLGYGVYLVHIPLIDHWLVPLAKQAVAHGMPALLLWPLAMLLLLLASWAIAYVMHVLIEKPALRIRQRVAG